MNRKEWVLVFVIVAISTLLFYMRGAGVFGTSDFKLGTVIEFSSGFDDRAPLLVDLRTHRVVSVSDLSARSSSNGLVCVTWLRFLRNGNMVVQYGDDIIEYDTRHRTKKILFSLFSSNLPNAAWAGSIGEVGSVLYIDKQGSAWLKLPRAPRKQIAKDVFSGADCDDDEHVFMLHKDFTLFEHNIATGRDRILHAFDPGNIVSYDIRGRLVAILDRDRVLIVGPDTTKTLALNQTAMAIGGIAWIDDDNVAITEDKGEYTLFSLVSIKTHKIFQLFRTPGLVNDIHSAVEPPEVLGHLSEEKRFRVF